MKPWVLIAEESDELARTLEKALGLEGCKVSRVRNGSSVQEEILKKDYRLVFVDSELTWSGGFSGLESPGGCESRVPVVLLADRVSQESARRAVEIGAEKILPRYVKEEELRIFVRSMLGSGFQGSILGS